MPPFRFYRRSVLAALLAAGASRAIPAEDFPARTIRFVVLFEPGSGTDTSARYFAHKLQELAGHSVVVENRPGANGFLAIRQVLAAPPDGHTVLIGSNSTLAVNAALFRALPYDPVQNFTPLTHDDAHPGHAGGAARCALQHGAKTLSHARHNSGTLNFGAYSAGYRLMAELLNISTKIQAMHVPL